MISSEVGAINECQVGVSFDAMSAGGRVVFGIGWELEGLFGPDLVKDEGVDGKVPGAVAGGE